MAIIFTPGQVVPTTDWEALFAQHGGAKSTQIRKPSKDEQRAADDAGDDLDQNPIYRYYAADGSYVEARRAPNGDYQVVDYHPSATFMQTTRAGTSGGPPGGKPYIDEEGPNGRRLGWDPNAYGPGQGGYTRDIGSSPSAQAAVAGASDTKPLEGYPGWNVRTTKVGTDTRTEFLDPQGQVAQDPRPSAAAAAKGEPIGSTTHKDASGNVTKVTIYRRPDGTTYEVPESATQEPAAPKAGGAYKNAQGQWVQPITDAQGNVIGSRPVPESAIPTEAKGYHALPAGVPRFTPDLTQSDLGLGARYAALDALVSNGTITGEQAAQALQAESSIATSVAKNAGSIVNIQEANRSAGLTARSQDITDASGRRNYASSTFQNTLSTLGPVARRFGTGPGAAEDAALGMEYALNMQDARARALGGFPEIAPYDLSQYPMLEQFGRAGIPGLPGGPPAGPGWTFGPPRGPGGPGGPPVGPGGVPQPITGPGGMTRSPDGTPYLPGPVNPVQSAMPGGWFTPSAASPSARALTAAEAAAVPGPPQIPMTPERVRGIMANPVFRPPPPVGMAPSAASPSGGTLRAAADGNPFDDPELGADLEQYLGIGRDAFETLPGRMPGSPGYQPPVFETLPGRLPGSPGYQPPVFETLPYRRSPGRFG